MGKPEKDPEIEVLDTQPSRVMGLPQMLLRIDGKLYRATPMDWADRPAIRGLARSDRPESPGV